MAESWRIEENRWAAARDGVEAELADLETGRRLPARELLSARIGQIAPVAERLGCAAELEHTRALIRANGAIRARAVAAEAGMHGVTSWLADQYLSGIPAPVGP